MAYDTTLEETSDSPSPDEPVCLQRDNLTSKYFPQVSRATLAAVIVLCAIFLLTGLHRLNHTDLWGHLNLGRWIAAQGELPAADPFGAAPAADRFTNVPWLGQWLGYLVWSWGGVEGLVLVHATLVTIACAITMGSLVRRCGAAWAVAGGLCVFILSLPIVGTIRPQLFGMVGVAMTIWLARDLVDRRRFLLVVPFLFAVWCNLHGSFAVGLVLLGVYLVAEAIEAARFARRMSVSPITGVAGSKATRRLATALLLAILGSCLNPLGPWLFWVVATFGSHPALDSISEWRPLIPVSLSGILFFSSLLAAIGMIAASGQRPKLIDVLLLVVTGGLALLAMRMLAWWALVWPIVAIPYGRRCWLRWSGAAKDADRSVASTTSSGGREASMRTLIAIGFVFMTLLISPASHALISGRSRGLASVVSSGTPLYMADELVRRNTEGNVFAPMDWADFLIWQTEGSVKPLVYSHVHLVSPETWTDYQQVSAGHDGWFETARRNNLKYLVISRARNPQLRSAVMRMSREESPRARIIYRDQQGLLVELL